MKLSNVLRQANNPNAGGKTLMFYCPACSETHGVNIEGNSSKEPQWIFNGDVNKPTFSPSVRVSWTEPSDNENEFDDTTKDKQICCHFFVTNGMISYCGDCTHEFKNRIVPMVEKY